MISVIFTGLRLSGSHSSVKTEIADALRRALTRPAEQMESAKEYINQLHAYNDGLSSRRVLEATDEFINKNAAASLKSRPLNLWRKLQMRKRMSYYRWK